MINRLAPAEDALGRDLLFSPKGVGSMKKLGKALKITGIVVGGLFVLVTLVGFALPRTSRVARTITIGAPPSMIYPFISNLKEGWTQWSPFGPQKYRDLQLTYSGPPSGPGAMQSWESPDSGEGKLRIVKADPQRGVEMELSMMHESFKATGSLLCEPAGQGTKVTWADEFDYGNNPYRRYFGLMLDRPLGKTFDEGLAALKVKAESRVAQQ